ncbi:MAG TPA: hypothetical protein VF611_10705 [Pyrinomonadaceae bacterium]
MKSRVLLLLTGTAVLLTTARYANANTATSQVKPVNDYYNIEAVYSKKQARVGNRFLELKVTVIPVPGVPIPAADRITLVNVEASDNREINVRLTSSGHNSNVYTYNVDLGERLEPRTYKLTLEFQSPRNSSISILIDLDVGVREKGKLRLMEVAQEPLVLGGEQVVKFKFANDYVDYPVNISRIKIDSIPSGIIDGLEVKDGAEGKPSVRNNVIIFEPVITIQPAQRHSLDIALKLGGVPSLQDYVMGFGDDSKLTVEVTYDDSNERTLTDLTGESPIKVRPSDRVLVGALILGLLAGTGIRFRLEYLRKKGAITRNGVAGFVMVTMIVGLVVFVVTWVGEIQIIAFKKLDLSYDRPGVIFILGFAGALTGVHYLNKWLKYVSPGE